MSFDCQTTASVCAGTGSEPTAIVQIGSLREIGRTFSVDVPEQEIWNYPDLWGNSLTRVICSCVALDSHPRNQKWGPGIGLIEPDPPWPGPVAPGSNLDAVDVDTLIMPGQPAVVYYSLDAAFMDPLRGVPNSGSAATIAPGIVGGDVLVGHLPGGPPVPYARAVQLGLDLFGPGTDDLNALALWENGTGAFERNVGPFSWVGGATDALFFSVRRGSALVVNRVPDSRCGLPIEEGDILVPPFIQGLPPAIWIPAESLGLATVRSGTAAGFGDDLDALDVLCRILGDLDQDGDVDLADLSTLLAAYGRGPAGDLNGDGVTDLSDLAIMLSQYGLFC